MTMILVALAALRISDTSQRFFHFVDIRVANKPLLRDLSAFVVTPTLPPDSLHVCPRIKYPGFLRGFSIIRKFRNTPQASGLFRGIRLLCT